MSDLVLRIYADFNSGGAPNHGACWNLRYGADHSSLDDWAEELQLRDGMDVLLFSEDSTEEIEVPAILLDDPSSVPRWSALPDWSRCSRHARG